MKYFPKVLLGWMVNSLNYQKHVYLFQTWAFCCQVPGPYDRITAANNNKKVRDQEEKNKIFNMY